MTETTNTAPDPNDWPDAEERERRNRHEYVDDGFGDCVVCSLPERNRRHHQTEEGP